MNRTLAVALLTMIGSAFALPALAQDNFPDVPENHWAYEAIENLKREGILVGYPDGTFKGPRDATRYEMAVAINAAYQRLKMMYDGLADQITEVKGMVGTGGGGDNKGLMDRLTALENQVRGMGRLSDDVAAMKRMADEFQKELNAQGVDIEEMKKTLADIQKRMSGNTNAAAAISISGDMNVLVLGGDGEDGRQSLGMDGRIFGTDENGANASLTRSLNVYHELGLNLSGGGEGTPKWWATLVYGNLVGTTAGTATSGLGNQGGFFSGQPFRTGSGDFYVQNFGAEISNSVLGVPFKATIGRIGFQTANPILYKRSDKTPYFKNERWDNGDWLMDGAVFAVNFGETASLGVFAGNTNNIRTGNGVELQPFGSNGGESLLRSTVGAEAKFKAGTIGDVSLAYLQTGQSMPASLGAADRLEIFGGQIDLNVINGIKIKAGFGQSNQKNGGTDVIDSNNEHWFVGAGYKADKWGLDADFRRVERDYLAPGSWGRLGTNYSPTNIELFGVNAWYDLTDGLRIYANGRFGETIDTVGGIPEESDITSGAFKLAYTFNEFWQATLGYEDTEIDFQGSANEIRQRWTTVGFNYLMSKGSTFSLFYQFGDVNNGAAWGAGPAGRYKGHIVGSQLSIKF